MAVVSVMAVGVAAVGVVSALGLPRAPSSAPRSQPRLMATVMLRLTTTDMPQHTATVTMMTAMPTLRHTVMPPLTPLATHAIGTGFATVYPGWDMAVIGTTEFAAYLVSATEAVTVADTSEQVTEEAYMQPAWGTVNRFV